MASSQTHSILPTFSTIPIDQLEEQLTQILNNNRQTIDQILQQSSFSWDNLIAPLEDMDHELERFWSPVEQLNATNNTPQLREVYQNCLDHLTQYEIELNQNTRLYEAIRSIKIDTDQFHQLNRAQQTVIDNYLRNFHLNGVDLSQADQSQFSQYQQRLSQLMNKFEENLLDSKNNWQWLIPSEQADRLQGLPSTILEHMEQQAHNQNQQGWLITLDIPVFIAIMQYAHDRSLRETVYQGFVTRASDQAETDQWDNSPIIEEIMTIRQNMAQLLGYQHYAELSLVTKMADWPKEVLDFLHHLSEQSRPGAEQELAAIQRIAHEQDGLEALASWDKAYYAEKLKQERFQFSEESLRPYFPLNQVLDGLFTIVQKLYGINIERIDDFDRWHDSVSCYQIIDSQEQLRGYFYTDLYTRSSKRSGAWMAECQNRHRLQDGSLQPPIAFLNCNFTPPQKNQSPLLLHDDVVTLFHEFGHTLHHLLTQVDYIDVAGINGVAWDAVEFPSQLMEGWCWEPKVLKMIGRHYQTGEAIPDSTIESLIASKNFQAGMQMLRQIEFSLFDFRLHCEYQPGDYAQVQTILDEVRQQVALIQPPDYNRFQHGFGHIFAGGYAAGYYSYKWAEVMASDGFAYFQEKGLFDPQAGKQLLHEFLEKGGSEPALDLFYNFRGHKPQNHYLLEQCGLMQNH